MSIDREVSFNSKSNGLIKIEINIKREYIGGNLKNQKKTPDKTGVFIKKFF